MKSQKGIAAIGAIVLLIVVLVVVATGYLVLRNREDAPVITEDTATTAPNGTVENAVNATNQQIENEIAREDEALSSEDKETELDASTLSELEGAANESNL